MVKMATDVPVFHKRQIDLLEFSKEFGDLTPIDDFRGPKTLSQRQTLRLSLHYLSQGKTQDEAGSEVVKRVLEKHPTVPASKLKAERTLIEDVKTLYKDARSFI